ncbi:unnamed protein product [Cylicocyclus nassatus]|uniref:Uncharacterized protein n=1 Tax=Cylicocyclus nassatus TaxID=53992 RepID=A0AA36GTK3_CYLNA|nr:unnamed protein product [Cylicocyclus nassatus]
MANEMYSSGRHVIIDRARIKELLKEAVPMASAIKNPQIRADFQQIREELETMRSQLQATTMARNEPAASISPKLQAPAIPKSQRQDTMVKQEVVTPALTPSPLAAATAKRPIVISSSSSSTSSDDEAAKPGPSQAGSSTVVKPPAIKTPTPKAKPGEVKKRKRGTEG